MKIICIACKPCGLFSLNRIHTVQRAMKQTKAAVQKEWQLIKSKLVDVEDRKKVQADMELVKIRLRLLRDEVKKQEQVVQQMQTSYRNTSSSLYHQCQFIIPYLSVSCAERYSMALTSNRISVLMSNSHFTSCICNVFPNVYSVFSLFNGTFLIDSCRVENEFLH